MAGLLCARAMMSYPQTVLRHTPGCVSLTRPFVPGSGAGQHPQTLCAPPLPVSKPERGANQPPELGETGPRHAGRSKTQPSRRCSVRDAGSSRAGPVRP
jgi:hypothetical protein